MHIFPHIQAWKFHFVWCHFPLPFPNPPTAESQVEFSSDLVQEVEQWAEAVRSQIFKDYWYICIWIHHNLYWVVHLHVQRITCMIHAFVCSGTYSFQSISWVWQDGSMCVWYARCFISKQYSVHNKQYSGHKMGTTLLHKLPHHKSLVHSLHMHVNWCAGVTWEGHS